MDNSTIPRLGDGSEATATAGPGEATSSRTVRYKNSVVEYYGASANYCGYCKRDETESEGRRSYDVRAHVLRASDYQELLDRGWRRSGNYCYRPINSQSCCPNYPLSCEALKFELGKSQRRCIENLNSFLVNGTIRDKLKLNYGSHNGQRDTREPIIESKSFVELKNSPKARDKRFVASCERKVKLYNLTLNEAIERTRKKNATRTKHDIGVANLEDYLYPNTANLPPTTGNPFQSKHSLRIVMHHVDSNDSKAVRVEENKLIQRYQKEIHKESPEEWTMPRYQNFLICSPIVVEPFHEEQEERQQQQQHKDGNYNDDTLTREIPNTFAEHLLVKPPDLPTAYGTYHCVYYLDGKIIAVGVLDVLPKCLTTVYFFYEPEYGFLNLGTYSALVEISMVRQMNKQFENQNKLIYYYLGFYVHECKKMHYKTKFHPSHLLCSETQRYVPTETCLKLLEGRKYSRFYLPETTSGDNDGHDELGLLNSDLNELSILDIPVNTPVTSSSRILEYFNWLNTNFGEDFVSLLAENILLPYIKLIGPALVPRVTLRMHSVHRALSEKFRKQENQLSETKHL